MVQIYDLVGNKVGSPTELSALGGPVSIAWNGSVFGVVWGDNYSGAGGMLYRAIDESGVPQGPVVPVHPANVQSYSTLVAVGQDFVLAFGHYAPPTSSKFYSARITATGSLVGVVNDISISSGRVFSAFFLPSSSGLLLFWTDDGSGMNAIYSRPFDTNGIPSGPATALTDGTTHQYVWSVAQVPQGYVVAGEILIPVDSTGLPSGNPVPSDDQVAAVAWNGNALAVLRGQALEFRSATLELLSEPVTFSSLPSDKASLDPYLLWSGRFFGISSTAFEPPVLRMFGGWGCNPPDPP